MPQLEPASYISQIFWLTVTFLCLWFTMSLFIIPRIKEIIEARAQKIEDYVQKAQTINKQALETLQRYEEAIEKAKNVAQEKIAEQRTALDQQIEERKNEMQDILSKKILENEQILEKERIETFNAADEISQKTAAVILQKLGYENALTPKKDS